MIKNIIIGAIVAILLVVGLSFTNKVNVGGTTNLDTLGLTGLYVGASGTTFSQIISGTMNCVSASTTAVTTYVGNVITSMDCPVSNVVLGDKVFVTLASTTPNGLTLSSAYASSTSGFVRVNIFNASSSAVTINTNSTSSLSYYIVR